MSQVIVVTLASFFETSNVHLTYWSSYLSSSGSTGSNNSVRSEIGRGELAEMKMFIAQQSARDAREREIILKGRLHVAHILFPLKLLTAVTLFRFF